MHSIEYSEYGDRTGDVAVVLVSFKHKVFFYAKQHYLYPDDNFQSRVSSFYERLVMAR